MVTGLFSHWGSDRHFLSVRHLPLLSIFPYYTSPSSPPGGSPSPIPSDTIAARNALVRHDGERGCGGLADLTAWGGEVLPLGHAARERQGHTPSGGVHHTPKRSPVQTTEQAHHNDRSDSERLTRKRDTQ